MSDNLFNKNIVDFKGLRIKLFSSEEILETSYGEVTKPETINYRTWRPEKDGLFCERIFGPIKDWECYCGKYKKIRFRGVICDKCGVEVTHSKVRRERMGHIVLAVPVTHIWYLKNHPLPLSSVLGIPQKELEAVIYFARYLVIDVDKSAVKPALKTLKQGVKEKIDELNGLTSERLKEYSNQEKTEKENLAKKIKNSDQLLIAQKEIEVSYRQKKKKVEEEQQAELERIEQLHQLLQEKIKKAKPLSTLSEEELFYLSQFNADAFLKLGMGSEAILEIIKGMDFKKLVKTVRAQIDKTSSLQKKKKLTQKLRLVKGFIKSETEPSQMILKVLPVIPPDLRPMVQLTGGRFATSDLNDLYRRVINRNNRLKRLVGLGAPDIILRNEKRMLQEAVDVLIDATKGARRRSSMGRRVPRSLSDLLRGKKGRFRKNLLGKRVDYSGRSVIVVGPELKLNECGLPKDIALEIFRPFILRELMLRGTAPNIKSAKTLLDHKIPETYDILDEVVEDNYVLLNRAPTLHKLSIQAFKPVLVDGLAIRLHPCVCSGFNADFDGDQMGVLLPLSKESQKESRKLMLASKNVLKPSDGSPVNVPGKEMAVGCYYATSVREQDLALLETDIKKALKSVSVFSGLAEVEYYHDVGEIQTRQLVAVKNQDGDWMLTTAGRVVFNKILPEDFGFINESINGKVIKDILTKVYRNSTLKEYVKLIDSVKDFGFREMTKSGISLAITDCGQTDKKGQIIKESNQRVAEIEENYNEGLITIQEKESLSRDVWLETTEKIASIIWSSMSVDTPIKVMSNAGAKRVGRDQIKQISGMRGLVVDPLGRIVPLPAKSNFREGLSVFEYVTGARGSRKGLTDTALKTADAGYLTRRLVDAAHGALIREEDCKTTKGLVIENRGERKDSFGLRIIGRVLVKPIKDPKTGKILFQKGDLLDEEMTEKIVSLGVSEVEIRSPLTCKTRYGICAKCYGWDLSNRKIIKIGSLAGIIAAQSIGEPGTQLTLRTKHSGGVIGLDVTQGLPRVQELFEVRTPKGLSSLSDIDGVVNIKEESDGWRLKVFGKEKGEEVVSEYNIPLSGQLLVKDGEKISKGTQLASGTLDVREVAKVRGISQAQRYLIDEIQKVYESQGIGIHDKHFEVIIREMSIKIRIANNGDTEFLTGAHVEQPAFDEENARAIKEKGKPAVGKQVILGITQAALSTSSWLSAASFQETTNVLTEAAILGKEDKLIGLKENVIIGRLIPISPERAKIE
jgi:DNA-directed RNA polymerase subunit beta'